MGRSIDRYTQREKQISIEADFSFMGFARLEFSVSGSDVWGIHEELLKEVNSTLTLHP